MLFTQLKDNKQNLKIKTMKCDCKVCECGTQCDCTCCDC